VMKCKKIYGLLLCSLVLIVMCIGCGKKDKTEKAYYDFQKEIGYDYKKSIASSKQDVLWKNQEETAMYQVLFHADSNAKEMAEQFETESAFLSKEESTWELIMWEYNRICYENQYPMASDHYYCSSLNWNIPVWKYVTEDSNKKTTTETLFFDRNDGSYSIIMTYPSKEIVDKVGLYYLASQQKFQADIERIEKIEEGITYKSEINKNGELMITVTNNADEAAEIVGCTINTTAKTDTAENAASISYRENDVEPGKTAIFTVESEKMDGVVDYEVDINVFWKNNMIDLEGKVWNAY